MENGSRTNEELCRVSFRDGRLASRKAEEAGLPFHPPPFHSYSLNHLCSSKENRGDFRCLAILFAQKMEDGRPTKEEPCRVSFRDGRLASRKADSPFHQAASWLESIVGPLGLPLEPTEKEFVSCLRSGIVLCNAINRIQPGAVPKDHVKLFSKIMSDCLEGQQVHNVMLNLL
ncbi:hypothetical protein B296_00043984 [Ensete ventricosum]|uniref:Calponin-homology (CH) domain-containing protein n=1 Tax=Ensete ventricosum TaxID=4639 RepID=A0A426Z1R7_ENSVE|nr:hypothetical protein B296_00043984 [Ensete ventricosum]